METQKPTIMVVDDELSIRESFSLILEDKYNVLLSASGEAALKKLVDQKIDAIYLDIRMPGMDGMETLRRLREIDRDVSVIMVTAVNDVQKAGEAIKLGAKNYVIKPFDVSAILSLTEKIIKKMGLARAAKELRSAEFFGSSELIGTGREIEKIKMIAEDIASKDLNVVISGEEGVEKELLARVIHAKSTRAAGPFISLAIAKEGVRDQREKLFGKGAGSSFATLKKAKGAFEEANGGTLYLINVENLSKEVQKDIAKALGSRQITREGSEALIPVDVRLVSSTAKNLKAAALTGSFSKELFDEAAEAFIELAALRKRSSDIGAFVEHFISKFNRLYGKSIAGLSVDALETLMGYAFPGNVDELGSILERIVLTHEEKEITCEKLPLYVLLASKSFSETQESKKMNLDLAFETLEKKFIERALVLSEGDVAQAAKTLELKPNALSSIMESLKISL